MPARDEPEIVRLPLTAATPTRRPLSPTITSGVIATIVDDFYAACRADPVLGPIFNERVQDWPSHLERIREFWGAALLGTGRYAGRPLEAHLAIPSLTGEHFSIWLKLFRRTVEARCSAEDAATFMTLAGRMANRIIAEGARRDSGST